MVVARIPVTITAVDASLANFRFVHPLVLVRATALWVSSSYLPCVRSAASRISPSKSKRESRSTLLHVLLLLLLSRSRPIVGYMMELETLDDNDDDDDIIDSFSFEADAMIAIRMACALAVGGLGESSRVLPTNRRRKEG